MHPSRIENVARSKSFVSVSFRAEAEAMSSAYSGGAAGHGAPPYGWYYFGPEPACRTRRRQTPGGAHRMVSGMAMLALSSGHHGPSGGAAPPYGQARDHNTDLKEAFDRLSRGDLSADTIGKLLGLDDRDFWTGALLGAAAALLATNLPKSDEHALRGGAAQTWRRR